MEDVAAAAAIGALLLRLEAESLNVEGLQNLGAEKRSGHRLQLEAVTIDGRLQPR